MDVTPFMSREIWKTFSNQNKAGGRDCTALYSLNSFREPFITSRRRKIKLSHSIPVIHLCIPFISKKSLSSLSIKKMRTPWTISRQTPKNNNKSENFPQYSFIPLLISYESVVYIIWLCVGIQFYVLSFSGFSLGGVLFSFL